MSPETEVFRMIPDPAALSASEAILSPAERTRASRFVFDRDRHRFILARAELRRLLAERLDVKPESVELHYGPHGKPTLADSDLRFNVSHCDDVAVFAFVRGCEIGVDVEAVRPLVDADSIASRFFSNREIAEYRSLDRREKPQGFFNCWTRKEAFVKAIGDGLRYPLQSFDVSLAPCEPARIINVDGWCVESFSPAAGFVAAVVTEVH